MAEYISNTFLTSHIGSETRIRKEVYKSFEVNSPFIALFHIVQNRNYEYVIPVILIIFPQMNCLMKITNRLQGIRIIALNRMNVHKALYEFFR